MSEKKVSAVYEMKVSSGCGFALNRKTSTTDKTLISNPVDGTLFVYNEKSKGKKDIKNVWDLANFFSEKGSDDAVIEPGWLSYSEKGFPKWKIGLWFEILTSEEKAIQYALRKNVLNFDVMDRNIIYELNSLYEFNPSLFVDCLDACRNLDHYLYRDFILSVLNMGQIYGIDVAKYLIEQKKKSSMAISISHRLIQKCKEYHFDARRLIDYIMFDCWSQGYREFGEYQSRTYLDYLGLQRKFYGKIKEKYPKHLEMQHNIMSMKVTQLEALKKDSPKFEEIMENVEDFSYSDSDFRIQMPEISRDLVEEGATLRHCVASYVEKVNSGDCLVVFMREAKRPDTPYLTVEILPNRTVSQVEGFNRRTILSEEEKAFLRNWAKEKDLTLSEDLVE